MDELQWQAVDAAAAAKPRSVRPPLAETAARAAAAPAPLGRETAWAGTWWVAALGGCLYLAHALLFGGWLIDDAGISFVYARNLAAGHGLVSQPGLPPVEGYSNFLWVLLLALPFWLGLFHPVATPKLLSLALVLGSFVLLARSLRLLSGSQRLGCAVVLLLAVNSAFVIWTSSGLENPLYVFLLCALFRLVIAERLRADEPVPPALPAGAGLLVTALALTRPDAILCGVLYPLLALVPHRGERFRPRAALPRLLAYGGALAASYGAFLVFRLLYFGQLLPNTYRAKGGLAPHGVFNTFTLQLSGLVKVLRLLGAVAGQGSGLLFLGLVAGTVYALTARRLRFVHLATAAFAGVTTVAYMLLPVDWMPGFRFATPVLPFLYAYALSLAGTLGEALVASARHRRLAANLGVAAALGLSLATFCGPSLAFAARPTVPMAQVARDFGLGFNRYAAMLRVRDASILLPDLGGTLYSSRLRVYDLAGLCDRTIARTLRHHQHDFYDYVFARLRPTFIHTHEYWTAAAHLEADPRFRRDYVPLVEYVEEWVRAKTGKDLHSGDFVRREVAFGQPAALRAIRLELARRYWRELQASPGPRGDLEEPPQQPGQALAAPPPGDLAPGSPPRPQDFTR
ncbi:MAG TPA: hypothetical protein VHQ90_16355 [Thermoanaerobaculia bacterium]|nr:hypothetical protein [Thermoanaerobaculia bacterium]